MNNSELVRNFYIPETWSSVWGKWRIDSNLLNKKGKNKSLDTAQRTRVHLKSNTDRKKPTKHWKNRLSQSPRECFLPRPFPFVAKLSLVISSVPKFVNFCGNPASDNLDRKTSRSAAYLRRARRCVCLSPSERLCSRAEVHGNSPRKASRYCLLKMP